MPVLPRHKGYRFFFYSREGMPPEPPHVHIRKDDQEAKLWLTPIVRVAWNKRFDPRTLKMLTEVTEEHRSAFEDQWHVYFG